MPHALAMLLRAVRPPSVDRVALVSVRFTVLQEVDRHFPDFVRA